VVFSNQLDGVVFILQTTLQNSLINSSISTWKSSDVKYLIDGQKNSRSLILFFLGGIKIWLKLCFLGMILLEV